MAKSNLYSITERLPNGRTRVRCSTKPLRFERGDGTVADLDSTLRLVDGIVVPAAMPFTFRTLPTGVGFVYGDERGETTYQLRGAVARERPEIAGNVVTYKSALPHTDVSFVVSRNGVRALKTLQNAQADRTFVWDVSGAPIRTREILGRDNAKERPVDHVPARRDLELRWRESPIVDGAWTLTEEWTGRVITFTKPDRIPQYTDDPVYPVTMDPTVGPLTQESDDGDELQGTGWNDRYYSWQAGIAGANIFDGGVRFANVTVPQAAAITSATLTFDVILVYGGSVNLAVKGDDVDDAPAWSDSSKPSSGFTATTASTTWQPAFGSEGAHPVDVTAIVQEIVDRAGWVSGNDMRFAIFNQGTGSNFINADASDTGQNETTLTIEYTVGGAARRSNTYLLS